MATERLVFLLAMNNRTERERREVPFVSVMRVENGIERNAIGLIVAECLPTDYSYGSGSNRGYRVVSNGVLCGAVRCGAVFDAATNAYITRLSKSRKTRKGEKKGKDGRTERRVG